MLNKIFAIVITLLIFFFSFRLFGEMTGLCQPLRLKGKDHSLCYNYILYEGKDLFSFLRIVEVGYGYKKTTF